MSERLCAHAKPAVVVALLALAQMAAAVPGILEDYHGPLTGILQDVVVEDQLFAGTRPYTRASVRYDRLRNHRWWQGYLHGLKKVEPAKLKIASLEDQKAFWINTYNALVLDVVVANYPVHRGVTSLRNVWSALRPVARSSFSLAQIEEKLRSYGDPRVWFALCQAARSSPALWSHAYRQTALEEQLERAANNFCADPANVRLERGANRLYLSQLFEKHAKSFVQAQPRIRAELRSYGPEERAILAFLLPRLPAADRQHILSKRPKVVYNSFDWTLNTTR